MEFNKLFDFFTVTAIIILLVITFLASGITVVNKAKSNLGEFSNTQPSKSCTQIYIVNC